MPPISGKKAIFFVTSPRTPENMRSEIQFLVENFSGQKWNNVTQAEFYRALAKQDFFRGSADGDVAFKARDRINRAPKALGLVDLSPTIKLTEAGREYIYGNRPEEIFLRQLLKFQFPSPFHPDSSNTFNVKPYLELMRLIKDSEGLSKDEVALFAMQLVDFRSYDEIIAKIRKFRVSTRINRQARQRSYNQFLSEAFHHELAAVFSEEIATGDIQTRETATKTVASFLSKKASNHRDYADAAIRYLRSTELFIYDPNRRKILVNPSRRSDVDFILSTIERQPFLGLEEPDYKEWLYSANEPALLVDDRNAILEKIHALDAVTAQREHRSALERLKDAYQELRARKIAESTESEQERLQDYSAFEEIQDIYRGIRTKSLVDLPLHLEWNTWRAFSMLDDGNIVGNFEVTDEGLPLRTAPGNKADIECLYDNFGLIVEVTLSSGQKQYEMEGEPVARHLGDFIRTSNKDSYCVFLAPSVSRATLAHFFSLHRINVSLYGGYAKIIPMSMDTFQTLITRAYSADPKPGSSDIRAFLDTVVRHAHSSADENEWISNIEMEAASAFS